METGKLFYGGISLALTLALAASSPAVERGPYQGSEFKGNYVWCIVMNLAWNELGAGILHEKPVLQSKDPAVLKLVAAFNRAPFSSKDLDAESSYVKSGFGQKTVELINRETKARFPGKTLAPLSLRLTAREFIAYAYFLKKVSYPVPFTEAGMLFHHIRVDGFSAAEAAQRETIRILKYWDDDRFMLSLRLTDPGDELLLIKGFPMHDPAAVMARINEHASASPGRMEKSDIFQMPKLHLAHFREYKELMGNSAKGPFFGNKGFTDYFIGTMSEKIEFDLDHQGARVEAEAVIDAQSLSLPAGNIRRFILDKPFWVVMKRAGNVTPYLIVGVNNPEIMKKR